jgi:3-methyladenine DNA glycosylase AlkD
MGSRSGAGRGAAAVTTTRDELVARLRALGSARNIEGMARFGISSRHEQLGVSVTTLRALARPHRRHHALAVRLWATGIFEAMMLATLVEDPAAVTPAQMERWVRACDNWALTDAVAFCFDRSRFAEGRARAWTRRAAEFQKRTGFALVAGMAVHRKELPDAVFLGFLPIIRREATDPRNFVRKAVNWALRQIGKRNPRLRRAAMAEARRIARIDASSARWIARDALRELESRGTPPRGVRLSGGSSGCRTPATGRPRRRPGIAP